MRILTITTNPWKDGNSIGNTISNWFYGWKDAEFSNIYFRSSKPQNKVCKNYYRITTVEIIKKIFSPQKIGKHFIEDVSEPVEIIKAEDNEKKLIAFLHKYNIKFLKKLEDFLWGFETWKNERLKSFVGEASPDIVFSFAIGSNQYTLMLKYMKETTKAKIVVYIADDVYGGYLRKKGLSSRKKRKNFEYIMSIADKIYAASEEMAKKYSEIFSKEVTPIYKGCDFENEVSNKCNSPLKMIYAGNLLYGRDDILANVVETLRLLNSHERKMELEIYTNTAITKENFLRLEEKNSSRLCGFLPYDEIKQKMSEADIVLHVESFDKEQIELVKYSFSTKIIDCLQSGSAYLAIGPDGISSIEYSKKIPGAKVITDLEKLREDLTKIVDDASDIPIWSKSIRDFAIKNHSISSVQEKLQKEFLNLIC